MEEETTQGGLEVQAPLRIGSERLLLLFTRQRLILAHVAKIGRVSMVFSSLLGRFSSGLSGPPSKRGALQRMAGMKPNEILSQDPDSFAVHYDQLVSLTVEPAEWNIVKLTLVTTDRKIELKASRVALEGLRETISSLLTEKALFQL